MQLAFKQPMRLSRGLHKSCPVSPARNLPIVLRPTMTAVAAPKQDEAVVQERTAIDPSPASNAVLSKQLDEQAARRKAQRRKEQVTYQVSAIAASIGISVLAIVATYLRFEWHLAEDGEIPWLEVLATLTLVAGGAFGMEMYARWVHKVMWHDFEPGWALHKSHHTPRTGPFEANDIYAVVNGVPAMALCLYGFLTPNVVGGMCFGAGLGITLFGMAYVFVHDGLVHRRFPVGPIAELPYLKRVAVAHQLHHSEKYGGAPYGMFLGPQELDAYPGAKEDLDRMVAELDMGKRKLA